MATVSKTAKTNGKVESGDVAIKLQPLQRQRIRVPIMGVTPVIPHKWSEKALKMMLAAQQGQPRPKKEAKNPEQEAHDATYWLPDGRPGIPATAFKAAITNGARYYDGVTMTMLKEAVFVYGEQSEDGHQLVPIEGEIHMREDTPRNATGVADLRYRNEIRNWRAELVVEFVSQVLNKESVIALVDAGGNGGVGDWRPSAPKSKTGTFGQFRVEGV
jgi:hypothetical protein